MARVVICDELRPLLLGQLLQEIEQELTHLAFRFRAKDFANTERDLVAPDSANYTNAGLGSFSFLGARLFVSTSTISGLPPLAA